MNRKLLLLLVVVPGCENEGLPLGTGAEARVELALHDDPVARSDRNLPGDALIAQLDRRDTRTLCERAGRAVDLCAVAARREFTQASCTAALETCRAQDPGPTTDCSDARFGFPGPCTATVQDYLGCVEAWNDEQTCTYDTLNGVMTPEECLPLLQKCPAMERAFGPASWIVPRCAADSPVRVDDDDDIVGLDCGRPPPTRMVALGDSIANCALSSLHGTCAPTLISEYMRERHVPELHYESLAVSGAITADVLRQASLIPPGSGHLLVWIYVGGNDLARCLLTRPLAQACIDDVVASLAVTWSEIFTYFSDPQRFPDGVSFMLNTQYSLFDQCEDSLGPEDLAFTEAAIQRFNREIIMRAALERADAVAIDQYPDFLGHARSANRLGCPHCYRGDNSPWLLDGTHPNQRGMQHIADKWKVAIDRAYATCQ